MVLTNALSDSAATLSSPQATSTSSSNLYLLDDVLKRLSDDDRASLQDHIFHSASDIDLALDQALAAAKEAQRSCEEKRWKFTFPGRTVIVKEEADKLVGWLNRFTAVGDVVANIDPVHVGLPWAGIRLLLEVKARASNRTTQRADTSIARLLYLRQTR